MSLRARFDKLEPRERRLLGILGGALGVLAFLVIPLGIHSLVGSRRSANEDIRAVVDSIYEQRHQVGERKAKHDALVARYARPAPALAGFLEQQAQAQGLTAAESQDRPDLQHGKRYVERMTVLKMHKIGMLPLAKMLEKIEQSGYPVAVTKLNLKPRSGEADSFEVELGISAYDRKAEAALPTATASPSASAPPEREP